VDGIAQRWMAIGRLGLEQAVMAIIVSVFKPERVSCLSRLPQAFRC